MRMETDVRVRWEAMTQGIDAIRDKMKESGLRIEAQHAKDVATAGRIQRELRDQIRVATNEGERQWERLKKSAKRAARGIRKVVKKAKEIAP